MPAAHVLIVDPPSPARERLTAALEAEGYAVDHAGANGEAARVLVEHSFEVLLGELSPRSGSVLEEALALPDGPALILFEDFAGVADAYDHLRRAAFDTLERPVPDDEVLRVVRRALEHRTLLAENRRLRSTVAERFELGRLVSRDPHMGRVFETAAAVADSSASILIEGESGTGKTVLARAIHERSARATGPFVAVNCGALPAALLESELFGHVRGAFTGAVKDRAGKFEAADGGTLFLDEIGTASQELQVKLLRVLEEGRFERVGESRTREVDARLISATNADLEQEVAEGRFRSDLYYRIHVVGIDVPPLRERVSDVPLLAERFVRRYGERHGRQVVGIDRAALSRLCAEPWPGNVRELENRIERAVLLSRGPILSPADLWPGDEARTAPAAGAAAAGHAGGAPRLEDLPLGPLKEVLGVPERWLIERALRSKLGNRQETARVLGINRTTLFNKMRKYDLLSLRPGSAAPDEPEA